MEHKFKVGDIITIIRSLTGIFKYKIVRIVENETTIKGPWVNGVDVVDISDSYIVEIIENPIIEHVGKIRMINFEMEDLYQCIPEVKNLNGEWNTTCKCGAPAFISMFSVTCSKGCNGQY